MAELRLAAPEPFNFKKPDEWAKWKRRFEQYRHASKLSDESGPRQVNTLLYCMGEEADDVLTSTNPTEDERKSYAAVVGKLDGHFKVRTNTIYERARFNRRNQLEGESAEQYITTLYSLIGNCEYGALKDELLRDRLVVGIRDMALSQKLQTDAGLTLEKAKMVIRQKEAIVEQQTELQAGNKDNPILVEAVNSRPQAQSATTTEVRQYSNYSQRAQRGGARGRFRPAGAQQCSRCGYEKHSHGARCPAIKAVCHRCNRVGHFSSRCLSKGVAMNVVDEIDDSAKDVDTAYLNAVSIKPQRAWYIKLDVENQSLPFKVDTGAEVTAITEGVYKQHFKGLKLEKPTKLLQGPTNQVLHVIGQFSTILVRGNNSSKQIVFVVKGLKNNLLGLPAITDLQVVSRTDAIQTSGVGTEEIRRKYPKLFNGLGDFGDPYEIKLKDNTSPHALYTPRTVPMPLREKVSKELDRMEKLGVISRVDEPTPWCAGMVVVPKSNGTVRICVDLKNLNESVLREAHPIPKVDEILAQLAGGTIFSKLDANSGFWQIPLAQKSRQLTTFITPAGRYYFNKLPFGVSSAPEVFQKRMKKILHGLPGVVCMIDDTLVFGSNQKEHDERLAAVMKRLEAANVTLNWEKCKFSTTKVKFLGHVVDQHGITADPSKTMAILQMIEPSNITELRRFMGMANQLGKFSPNLAEASQPLRELLSPKHAWLWTPHHQEAFCNIKKELSKPTVLALYNPLALFKVSADASSFGLGAVLLQKSKSDQEWKPVAYASRSMSTAERRYAQIEKEALAVTWACEKFHDYILGSKFSIESDHKPLIPLLSTKSLDHLPPRIVRFRLRLDRYCYSIHHVAGKELHTADTLSRAPLPEEKGMLDEIAEIERYMEMVTANLPAGETRLEQYRQAQQDDELCKQVIDCCKVGWPQRHQVDGSLVPYWRERASLTLHNNLLLFNHRIVIPLAARKQTLRKIHEGHQGVERCRLRVRASVWWPGVSKEMEEMVRQCPQCAKAVRLYKEPLIVSELPQYPWQVAGSDLFELDGNHYILVVDYFSRYPEVIKLKSTTSSAIIMALKAVFSRYGIPEVLRTDNGPQFISQMFKDFGREYSFRHVTSSPRFPQSNGQAERTVQTVKQILKQSNDPYQGLLNYRVTPLPWCNLSPAQLSMGRCPRTTVPQTDELLIPRWTYLDQFRKKNHKEKARQMEYYNKGHNVRTLPDIPGNTSVWITTEGGPVEGTVVSQANRPRSYVIETPLGKVERNRFHIRVKPSANEDCEGVQTEQPPNSQQASDQSGAEGTSYTSRIMTRTQTGTAIDPPDYYRPS